MTLLQIAWRNVRHQARNYAAYFLSSTFAVWMFFLYGSLLLHPNLNLDEMPPMIRQILLFIEGVVALFSVLFVLYAHSAFLKARIREIATLALLGARPAQIAAMVRWENLIIGFGAITAGVGLGLLLLKLFLLAMSRVLLLKEPIPFALSWPAIGATYGAFLLIFLAISVMGARRLRRSTVAEALRDGIRPKEQPAFAWWKLLLCIAALVPAYLITLTADGANIGDRLFYALLLLIFGTYLLLSQGSVALLRLLQRRPALYTRRTNLLVISQLIYKLRENARIHFMVAILSTLSLIATGIFYSAWIVSAEKAAEFDPVGLQIYGEPGGLTPGRVEAVLQEHGVAVTARSAIPVVQRVSLLREGRTTQGQAIWQSTPAPAVMPLSALNEWLVRLGREPLSLGEGGGIILSNGVRTWPEGERFGLSLEQRPPGGSVLWTEPEAALKFRLERVLPMESLNEPEVLVLEDGLFQQAARAAQPTVRHLWMFQDWRRSVPAVLALAGEVRSSLPPAEQTALRRSLTATGLTFHEFRRENGLGLFLVAFVAALFFLASGNMLYFKLFTDLYDDRRQFRALGKIGILPAEVRRVVSTQTLILFFVPLVLAVVNAAVALRLFARIFAIALWEPLAVTAGGYTLLYLAYWAATRRTYVRALLSTER